MSGCFRTVGCLTVGALVVVGAYVSRDIWLPKLTGKRPGAYVQWERVTEDRGERARNEISSLGTTSGPVFTTLSASDVSALVLAEAQRRYPGAVQSAEAAVVEDQVKVRASIDLSQLRGMTGLGPLESMLGNSRQNVELTGTLDVVRPGVAELRVKEVKVGELIVPPPAIPQVVSRLSRGQREPGVAADGIPFPIPPYIGDVRVGKGKITLYKTVK
jgi:hypothetical protein